ncbi:MAG: hypothetical protein ACOYOU_03225 [Kiritimatiellia bacterium]
MNEHNETQKEEAGACGPGCNCGTSGSSRWRWVVGCVVLLAACALVVRAASKSNGAPVAPVSTGFAALPTPPVSATTDVAALAAPVAAIKELAALSELNTLAGDTMGVFVFLPGTNEASAKIPADLIRGAVKKMKPQLNGGEIGIFTLKAGTPDYVQIAKQMAVPGVLALVKGRGMAPVTGDLTEAKLIQGFAAASSAGGCGPASSGCGPTGCK